MEFLAGPQPAARQHKSIDEIRVALFSGNYNYVQDGAALTLNRLVTHLEGRGIETLVFAPTRDGSAFPHAGTLVSVPSIPLPVRSEYRLAMGLPAHVRSRLRAFRPTLFHLSAPDALGYAAAKLASRWSVPAVATFHTRYDAYLQYYGIGVLERYMKKYLRRFYSRCDQVYAPSEALAGQLRADGIGSDIRVWSRGVDCARFGPHRRDPAWREAQGLGEAETVIAFCGRLVLEKGLKTFADTVRTLRQAGVPHRILVIGDGPERRRFAEWLPTDAIFTGFLSGETLARAYASADIFFNPSVTETFGNVTLEAMASGLPAVCAETSEPHPLVLPGQTGLLAGTADGFADALRHLAGSPALRRRMGAAGRRHAGEFAWDRVMESMIDHYRDVLRGYGPGPLSNLGLGAARAPASNTQHNALAG